MSEGAAAASEGAGDAIGALARGVIERARAAGLVLATAESLTAGRLVARLVDVPGASACVAGGAACYSYEAKTRILGVDAAQLERTGAVTESVARQMAEGALRAYGADLAVATTGVAGPGPDACGVAAGTVHLALAQQGRETIARALLIPGDRETVREETVREALLLLREAIAG